jgi:protocatechuate 3,4-dioxygenase beta subunit
MKLESALLRLCAVSLLLALLSPAARFAGADDDTESGIPNRVTVFGRVLDAETGEPVKTFIVQGGRFDPDKPGEYSWGFSERRGRSERFSATVQWNKGWTARILADGYLQQPVITKLPRGKDRVEVTIRLKPGRLVAGRVLGHEGKPVPEATVFAMNRSLNLVGKKAMRSDREDTSALRVLTDKDGRFEIPIGEATGLAISTDRLECWQAPLPKPGEEAVIRLPEAGTLALRYHIEGAPDECENFLQLIADESEHFDGLHTSQKIKLPNGEGRILRTLPPATYQIGRLRMIHTAARLGFGRLLDMQKIKVESGKELRLQFIRPKGTPVKGRVELKDGDVSVLKTIVSVYPEPRPGEKPQPFRSWGVFDAQATDANGEFQTEPLEPGTYKFVAELYLPLTPAQQISSGFPTPRYVGTCFVVIPESGDMPEVVIELKDTQKK